MPGEMHVLASRKIQKHNTHRGHNCGNIVTEDSLNVPHDSPLEMNGHKTARIPGGLLPSKGQCVNT